MKILSLIVIALVWLAAGGCAVVPEEAVELSATLGNDLDSVQSSHKALATLYFDRIETHINSFIDDVYRPYVIREGIARYGLVDSLVAATESGRDSDAFMHMEEFVIGATKEIESFRRDLLVPVRENEVEILTAIDDTYEKLRSANTAITGHLASVRKVKATQAELLRRAGLEGLDEKLVSETARLSLKIDSLLAEGRRAEDRIEEVARIAGELRRALEQ